MLDVFARKMRAHELPKYVQTKWTFKELSHYGSTPDFGTSHYCNVINVKKIQMCAKTVSEKPSTKESNMLYVAL